MPEAKSFRIIIERHIHAVGHGLPIEAAANLSLAASTNPRSDLAVRSVSPWAASARSATKWLAHPRNALAA
jgi:hypothetical protein